jgi:hypothetical protein
VWPVGVVVRHALGEHDARAPSVQDERVLRAFGTDGTHHPLGDGVRLQRAERDGRVAMPDAVARRMTAPPVGAIATPEALAGLVALGCRLDEPPPHPGRRRVRGHSRRRRLRARGRG